tara:strand:- start:7180 stop:7341 length:162 start_codon:yes stop_codon:yes gene_type:complete
MDRIEKMRKRVAEGEAWWADYVAKINEQNADKVAIGCVLNPDKPLTSERRYVD